MQTRFFQLTSQDNDATVRLIDLDAIAMISVGNTKATIIFNAACCEELDPITARQIYAALDAYRIQLKQL